MFTVYILRDQNGNLYKGATSNLERRLKEHRKGNTKTTRRMEDLNVVYTEIYETFAKARAREVYLKSAAGRRFLKKKMGV
ncbi:MAG: GIY-YIG nuclease family protein [bacterium]|nr:GIY-YIG nuclease family protein [bacterium]